MSGGTNGFAAADAAAQKPIGVGAWLGQAVLYSAFALFIGVFSNWPAYRHLQDDQSLIEVSFTHAGQPVAECKQQSAAELAKLPPNMRAPVRCPRERSPVIVELDIGGVEAYRHVAEPQGLAKDGASSVYQRLVVPAGSHRIAVRLNDDARSPGYVYALQREVTLSPGQILVVDFDASTRQITLR